MVRRAGLQSGDEGDADATDDFVPLNVPVSQVLAGSALCPPVSSCLSRVSLLEQRCLGQAVRAGPGGILVQLDVLLCELMARTLSTTPSVPGRRPGSGA